MEIGLLVKNTVIVGAIMGVAFLSQQPWFSSNSKNFVYSQGIKSENQYIKSAAGWIGDSASKLSGSVNGGALQNNPTITSVEKGIENQKNNFLQNSVDSTKKFIATELLNALGVKPQDLGACKAN